MSKECSMCQIMTNNPSEYHTECITENAYRLKNNLCVRCKKKLSVDRIEYKACSGCMFKPFLYYPGGK